MTKYISGQRNYNKKQIFQPFSKAEKVSRGKECNSTLEQHVVETVKWKIRGKYIE